MPRCGRSAATSAAYPDCGLFILTVFCNQRFDVSTRLNRNIFNKGRIFNLLSFIGNFMAKMMQEVYV